MRKKMTKRRTISIQILLGLAVSLSAVAAEPPADLLKRLRKEGFRGRGSKYGIYNDVEALIDKNAPADDVRWQNIHLRVGALQIARIVTTLDPRTKHQKRRESKKSDAKLLTQICETIGPAADGLAAELKAMGEKVDDEKDPKAQALRQKIVDLGRRVAQARNRIAYVRPDAVEAAIRDLTKTFPKEYPNGDKYLAQLSAFRKQVAEARELLLKGDPSGLAVADKVFAFQQKALLDNPLLQSRGILVVRRDVTTPIFSYASSAEPTGARTRNEIAIFPTPGSKGEAKTIFKPGSDRFVGHLEIDWNAEKVLFTSNGKLLEMRIDGGEPVEVVKGQPRFLSNFDGCYLPDGRIVFCSHAGHKGVPCEDGGGITQSLFLLSADRKSVRRLTFDQDHDWHPSLMNDGQVMYTRWDYTDAHHYYARLLFAMNPDGTTQMAIYGSNGYFPNGKMYSRAIPWQESRVITVELGHVEPIGRAGRLLLLDLNKGQTETQGVLQVVPDKDAEIKSHAKMNPIGNFNAPRFTEPWPLADAKDPRGAGNYFLASCKLDEATPYAVYLVDVFGNMVQVADDPDWHLKEPMPLRPRFKPPAIPDRINTELKTGNINLMDVYVGDGLKNVPRGAVKKLRVYAYHFGYHGIGGHHAIGINSGWDARRILGTVPVEEDGSAFFTAPANTPIAVQPLDSEGRALQIMRSWYTLMPGENGSCIGCHEDSRSVPRANSRNMAMLRGPKPIDPWYGPARPFSYEREVQPVLDRFCIGCHDGSKTQQNPLCYDLRGRSKNTYKPDEVNEYQYPDTVRLPNDYFPGSYRILQRYVRRYRLESDYVLRNPAEYHVRTSPLIQMLKKGHHGVELNKEAWDRLYTWIDLNAPCYGTWTEVAANENDKRGRRAGRVKKGHEERLACDKAFGGADFDPEAYPDLPKPLAGPPVMPDKPSKPPAPPELAGWPMNSQAAAELQKSVSAGIREIPLAGAPPIKLIPIPAGKFVMGDPDGYPDEQQSSVVTIDEPFYMACAEITNEQFKLFQAEHYSGYYDNLGKNNQGKGKPLNNPQQPVIRVSWREAVEFCQWLSEKSGRTVRLPTEAEWEWACRAGTASAMNYGSVDADFSKSENLADLATVDFLRFHMRKRPIAKRDPGMTYLATPFALDPRFNDGQGAPNETASFKPNAWGLHDMHGSVQEWTSSKYKPYPYNPGDGREGMSGDEMRVVRGGSWADRPKDARSGIRRFYPPWQRVWNVGVRIVVEP